MNGISEYISVSLIRFPDGHVAAVIVGVSRGDIRCPGLGDEVPCPRLDLGAPAEAVIGESVVRVVIIITVAVAGQTVIFVAVGRTHAALLGPCQPLYAVVGIGCLVVQRVLRRCQVPAGALVYKRCYLAERIRQALHVLAFDTIIRLVGRRCKDLRHKSSGRHRAAIVLARMDVPVSTGTSDMRTEGDSPEFECRQHCGSCLQRSNAKDLMPLSS